MHCGGTCMVSQNVLPVHIKIRLYGAEIWMAAMPMAMVTIKVAWQTYSHNLTS